MTNEQQHFRVKDRTAKQREAIDAAIELRTRSYDAEMNLVHMAWEADNVPRVRELLTG